MTKRVPVISALTSIAVVILASWFALHDVPSPFVRVTLPGDTVVAQIRPGTSFGFVRQNTRVGEHISDSASIELRDGESVMLGSPHTGYTIACGISAGLYIQGSWSLPDFLRSSLKTWFVEAH
ncbi:MAG TPA: hypothetical protein VM940_00230 [Chthoniobacterales bacterium]|jgi:hypothetical protein|nr:hypothetical protein [Chthoniobacterales bacterium]